MKQLAGYWWSHGKYMYVCVQYIHKCWAPKLWIKSKCLAVYITKIFMNEVKNFDFDSHLLRKCVCLCVSLCSYIHSSSHHGLVYGAESVVDMVAWLYIYIPIFIYISIYGKYSVVHNKCIYICILNIVLVLWIQKIHQNWVSHCIKFHYLLWDVLALYAPRS